MERCPIPGACRLRRSPARRPAAAACWPRRSLALGPGGLGKGRRKTALLGSQRAGGAARVRLAGGPGAWWLRPTARPPGPAGSRGPSLPFPSPSRRLRARCLLTWRRGAGRRGRGGRGLRGCSHACSGARSRAAATAAALFAGARPCASLLNGLGAWLHGSPPRGPAPSPLSVSFSAVVSEACNSHPVQRCTGPCWRRPAVPTSRTCCSVPPPGAPFRPGVSWPLLGLPLGPCAFIFGPATFGLRVLRLTRLLPSRCLPARLGPSSSSARIEPILPGSFRRSSRKAPARLFPPQIRGPEDPHSTPRRSDPWTPP